MVTPFDNRWRYRILSNLDVLLKTAILEHHDSAFERQLVLALPPAAPAEFSPMETMRYAIHVLMTDALPPTPTHDPDDDALQRHLLLCGKRIIRFLEALVANEERKPTISYLASPTILLMVKELIMHHLRIGMVDEARARLYPLLELYPFSEDVDILGMAALTAYHSWRNAWFASRHPDNEVPADQLPYYQETLRLFKQIFIVNDSYVQYTLCYIQMLEAVDPHHGNIDVRLKAFVASNDTNPSAYKLLLHHLQLRDRPIKTILPLCLAWASLDPLADEALAILTEHAAKVPDRPRLLHLLGLRVEHGGAQAWVWIALAYELTLAYELDCARNTNAFHVFWLDRKHWWKRCLYALPSEPDIDAAKAVVAVLLFGDAYKTLDWAARCDLPRPVDDQVLNLLLSLNMDEDVLFQSPRPLKKNPSALTAVTRSGTKKVRTPKRASVHTSSSFRA
ncbi:hypothetical protein SeMB42_g02793 [Synchytrium endobioticum]|uniref:Uncharacterized protein n=1 Tax=Synchytrium endobioticum TaxID=286115 RepID=A0A507DC28_9FUNG|nr:hypothetical protein SeLEV6574_g04701 [Synchytrium endobioticum]TPX48941.1 hypothetical protein SeMB42_g02793 [Synchytrium endobioticum]